MEKVKSEKKKRIPRKRTSTEERIKKHKQQIEKLKAKILKHEEKIKKLEDVLSFASTPYAQLLNQKEWKERRKEIFKLKGKVCSKCGATKDLHVHHLYYENGKKPWEYPDDALIVLCKDCHNETHGYQ